MSKKQIIQFVGATLIYWGYCYASVYIGGRLYISLVSKFMK